MIMMDGMELQNLLRQEETVSLAWLQDKMEMNFAEVRQLSDLLIRRGWLSEGGTRGYTVEKERLFFRKLHKCEVGKLVDELTNDCYMALDVLREQQADGAAFKDLEKAVRGDSDTRTAIEILERNRLIFAYGDYYFLRVSKRTVEVIKNMLARKRIMERREMIRREQLISIFDELFS